jgi:hypothetical protein
MNEVREADIRLNDAAHHSLTMHLAAAFRIHHKEADGRVQLSRPA